MRLSVNARGPSPVKKLGLPALSTEDIDRFHRQGFLAIERFTTPEDLARIRITLDELYARFRQLPPEHTLDLGDQGWHNGPPRSPKSTGRCAWPPGCEARWPSPAVARWPSSCSGAALCTPAMTTRS